MIGPDAITVEPVLSSISPDGVRLDTVKLTYPRLVHAEIMTHRVFSRNASSSRAIPVSRLSDDDIYMPLFRKNQPGMQPGDPLDPGSQAEAQALWREAAEACQRLARTLGDKDGLNVHKQWANRPLEWFGSITAAISSTAWENFWALRIHQDAQDEARWLAEKMQAALDATEPTALDYGMWHLPFIRDEDYEMVDAFLASPFAQDHLRRIAFAFPKLVWVSDRTKLFMAMSAARCARASYRNFDGSRLTVEKDIETFLKLGSTPMHASPFEHQASPARTQSPLCGNFTRWDQFRKFIPEEAVEG